jgi:UDP-N-acetyl-D-glucosamine dehydrogenase
VPTPVDQYQVPDLSILKKACASVVDHAVPDQLFILTSTTYVGSTWDLLGAPLADKGLTAGKDVFVAFSPERINPGTDLYAHEDVPRVVGGVTPACGIVATTLLATSVNNVHSVPNAETAEMTKLMENTFRAVNIALANEFADICHALKLNVKDVIEAAATKPYGFMPFIPGPGVGGHCIPCDPHYLLWQMKKERLQSPVIEQAMNAIAVRPRRVVESAIHALSERDMYMRAAKVLVVGVAYKPDVADLRQSPALEILTSLIAEGASVHYHDPRFETLTLPNGHVLVGVKEPRLLGADLTILHTAHSDVDLQWLADERLVLDTTYQLTDLPHLVRP